MANNVDLDEVAHHEPLHQDLRCLPIQVFSSLVVKELKERITAKVSDLLIYSNLNKLRHDTCCSLSRGHTSHSKDIQT